MVACFNRGFHGETTEGEEGPVYIFQGHCRIKKSMHICFPLFQTASHLQLSFFFEPGEFRCHSTRADHNLSE